MADGTLRQAYKAVYTENNDSAANLLLISVDLSAYVKIYCESDDGSFAFEINRGNIRGLSFKPQNDIKILKKLKYAIIDSLCKVYYENSTKGTVKVKTNIIFGNKIDSFLSTIELIPDSAKTLKIVNDTDAANVFEIAAPIKETTTGEMDFATAIENGAKKVSTITTYIKKESDDTYKQYLDVPGGVTTSASGKFSTITITSTVNVPKYGTSTSAETETLDEHIKALIEKEYLYDGKYTQD